MTTIKEIRDKIKSGQMTAVEAVTEALRRAKIAQDHNVFIRITEERALARAQEIDARLAAGEEVGALAGVPFVNKDNILAFDGPTTAASKILSNFETPLQATVIEKLEAAGAISIGKANLDAFAHGGSTENSAFGLTKNAVDETRVAGGSSGGSAAAVALDVVPFALGTDTGGSIREPASFNGVVGFKPTYGLVSRFGVIAMSSSTDTVGCFAHIASDIDLVMSLISGQDSCDMTTYDSNYQTQELTEKPKLAVPKQFMTDAVDSEVKASVQAKIEQLKQAGYQVDEVDIEELKYALAIYYIVVPAEVSSNLARYDGVRYGVRTENVTDLASMYANSRAEGFEKENKRRIMIGSFVLSSGYFDAYYLKAQKVRTLLIKRLNEVLAKYDYLLGPVVPEPAFKIGQNTADPLKMYLADVLTTPANLAGLPAISVPIKPTSNGLPVGLQIIGSQKSDAKMLAFVRRIEELK
ncbi:MAG: Asp-tRNA(Asn)/Glu-tRNA(Gln) amidotransferase subunit GatA [Candidatus Saccharibacteria bacterium]|nr:Asp-tRNA(Asn)/Glu-tRNA(Gln) amidotransferase subunit GatA [Candidatus Saccharibacteria bacterium]